MECKDILDAVAQEKGYENWFDLTLEYKEGRAPTTGQYLDLVSESMRRYANQTKYKVLSREVMLEIQDETIKNLNIVMDRYNCDDLQSDNIREQINMFFEDVTTLNKYCRHTPPPSWVSDEEIEKKYPIEGEVVMENDCTYNDVIQRNVYRRQGSKDVRSLIFKEGKPKSDAIDFGEWISKEGFTRDKEAETNDSGHVYSRRIFSKRHSEPEYEYKLLKELYDDFLKEHKEEKK